MMDRETQLQIAQMYSEGQTQQQVAETLGHSVYLVRQALRVTGTSVRPKTTANTSYFAQIDSEEKAYWLGFIIADGNVTGDYLTIRLGDRDREHLYSFRDSIGSSSKVTIARNKGASSDHCTFKVGSPKIVADLSRYGVVPAKTRDTYVPLDLIPSDLHRHFWRGLIDGDGWVTYRISKMGHPQYVIGLAGTKSVVTSFANFIKGEVECIRAGDLAITEKNNAAKTCQTALGSRQAFAQIGDLLYGESQVALARKLEVYRSARLTLRGLTYTYAGEVFSL